MGTIQKWICVAVVITAVRLGVLAERLMFLDTTTITGDLNWTKYPPGEITKGWQEQSYTAVLRNNSDSNFRKEVQRRSHFVCDVGNENADNWFWTPYIERGVANRIAVEIQYKIKKCSSRPCTEVLNLMYYESDSSKLEPHPWEPQEYKVAGRFGYDKFSRGADKFDVTTDEDSLTEERSIAISRRGVFFAFKDEGACASIFSVKIFTDVCPEVKANFARFPETPVSEEYAGTLGVRGKCVENAVEGKEPPLMDCYSSGL